MAPLPIRVQFGDVTLKNVRTVTWTNQYNRDLLVDKKSKQGHLVKVINVEGFILVPFPSENTAAQQQLETSLRNVGVSTLQYTGIDNVENCRFVSLDFDAFRGNPQCIYTIRFETESPNPHAHGPIKVDLLDLVPEPAVVDTIKSQGPDEKLSALHARDFKISGRFCGTLAQVNALQEEFENEVKGKSLIILTLTDGIYSARPRRLEFSSPEVRDQGFARSYVFECSMHELYTIEPYTIGHSQVTYGNITFDVLQGVKHDGDFYKEYGSFLITEEELNVKGKKYFADYDEWKLFNDTLVAISLTASAAVHAAYTYVSATGNTLNLTNASVSDLQRDGNFPDNSKRYSATVDVSWRWVKNRNDTSIDASIAHFGIVWLDIQSVSFSASVNEKGVVTKKDATITGRILESAYAGALAKLGEKVDYDANLKNLYVTSVSTSNVEQNMTASGLSKIYSISVTAAQLDSAEQQSYFLGTQFVIRKDQGTNYGTIIFDHVNNRSKSVSSRYDATQQQQIVTGISLSISGDIFQIDSNNKPANENAGMSLLDLIDGNLKLPIQTDRNASEQNWYYFLTSFSVGEWTSFKDPNDGFSKWRRSISINATVAFEASAANSGGGQTPDVIDTRSEVFDKESPRFQTLQVLGYGTVFKKIGINPATATVTTQKQFTSTATYNPNEFSGLSLDPPAGFPSKHIITKETRETRGLVNRLVREYTATESSDTG